MARTSDKARYVFVTPSTLPHEYEVTQVDLWRGLKEVTTAHGIPHVTRAKGEWQRGTSALTLM